MPDEDKDFGGSLILDFGKWWRHVKTICWDQWTTSFSGPLPPLSQGKGPGNAVNHWKPSWTCKYIQILGCDTSLVKICLGISTKNIVKKTNQRLGHLRRIKPLLPLHARLTLYHSLILPLFVYGDIIWGDKNNIQLIIDLQAQENMAAK